jgi:hypothetical protein
MKNMFKNPWAKGGEYYPEEVLDVSSLMVNSLNIDSAESLTPAGKIKFINLTIEQLKEIAVIPEEPKNDTDTFTPKLNVLYSSDGCFWKKNTSGWLKVPNDCSAIVSFTPSGNIKWDKSRGWIAASLGYQVQWKDEKDDKHWVKNPFKV